MRALALLFLILLLVGCASPASESVEFVDVHGLAIDPTDASTIYVATHRGLIRGQNDRDWTYAGDARDDYMGFSMHPREGSTFWASGHPSKGGNLGVIQSMDAGTTWSPIGATGVDFHAMAVSPADPDRLWGHWRGEIHRSDDAGRTWSIVSRTSVSGFAPHPTDRDVVFAANGKSVLRSGDAGATWTQVSDFPALGLVVDPNAPDVLYAGAKGGAAKSDDAGRTWTRLTLNAGTLAFLAIHQETPGLVYAASYETGIYKSTDAGVTWTTVRER